MKTKKLMAAVAVALTLCVTIGGTLAWLTDSTGPVVNTFTVGNIDITLTETWNTDMDEDGDNDSWTGKMVPGNTITKDPTVTVEAGSEACWLFVKVEKSSNLDTFIEYTMANGWTQLKDEDDNDVEGVYYREVSASNDDQDFGVLADNEVTVKDDVEKEDMDGLTEQTLPTLTFTAYAVQKDNIATAAAAWAEVSE